MPVLKSNGEVNQLTVTNSEVLSNTKDEPLVNNQKIRKGRGGPRPNSGRKKGALQKLGGKELLAAIERATGKSFEDNIAEHYNRAIVSGDWNDVRDYEKFIISKVISDVKEVDITSNGQPVAAAFVFPSVETGDWEKQ